MKAKRGSPGEDPLTTHWERKSGAWTHYIWVGPYYVECGSHAGPGQSDNSQRILHDRFLAGEYQGGIEPEFGGDVLQEVIHTVSHGQEVPRFVEEWRAAKTRLAFWRSIPIDPMLAELGAHADEDGYRQNYCNVKHPDGSDETVVRAGNVELHLDGWQAHLVDKRTRLPVLHLPVYLEANHSAAIGHGRHFYVADHHLQVFGLHGLESHSTRDLERRSGIGTLYRVVNVPRSGDRFLPGITTTTSSRRFLKSVGADTSMSIQTAASFPAVSSSPLGQAADRSIRVNVDPGVGRLFPKAWHQLDIAGQRHYEAGARRRIHIADRHRESAWPALQRRVMRQGQVRLRHANRQRAHPALG